MQDYSRESFFCLKGGRDKVIDYVYYSKIDFKIKDSKVNYKIFVLKKEAICKKLAK